MKRYILFILLTITTTILGLMWMWSPTTYQSLEEPQQKGHIRVRADTVHCVRWYPDEPGWCIIHVGEDKVYEITSPGPEVWELIFEGDRTHYLTFKLR